MNSLKRKKPRLVFGRGGKLALSANSRDENDKVAQIASTD
jgi:hypothetical protein